MCSNWTKAFVAGLVSVLYAVSSPASAEVVLKAITYAPPSKNEDSMVIFKKWMERVNTAGKGEIRDWETLVGDGSVRRLILSVDDVNKAFEKSGNAAAAARPEEGDPDDTFIDLYVADVAVPAIGRSLLGDDGFNRLTGRLKPGQHALVVAGSGRYSFKGAA